MFKLILVSSTRFLRSFKEDGEDKGIKTVDGGRGAVEARPQAEVLLKFVTCSGLLIAMYSDTTVGRPLPI